MKTLLALKRRGRQGMACWPPATPAEFHSKWIRGDAPPGEPLIGSADIQSLADLANSYDVVSEMKPVPFGKDTIVQIVGAIAIPLLPLALTVVPAEEIIREAVRVCCCNRVSEAGRSCEPMTKAASGARHEAAEEPGAGERGRRPARRRRPGRRRWR